jgi:peptidoglycan hydrolase-like protein with peptidoglycan-binding domain
MAEPVLRRGSTEPEVRDLQEALKALGHDPGPVDGVFGARTEDAVRAFQQAKGIAVDGIVGRVTWINIDEADQSEPVLRTEPRRVFRRLFGLGQAAKACTSACS